jgi:uncharacterized repeat protein (TIGR04052 family)
MTLASSFGGGRYAILAHCHTAPLSAPRGASARGRTRTLEGGAYFVEPAPRRLYWSLTMHVLGSLLTIMACLSFAVGGCSASPTSSSEVSDPRPSVRLEFRPLVNGAPFVCGRSYVGVGSTAASVEVKDLRFYVSDVELVRMDGSLVTLALEPDGAFQTDRIALLDFEDSACGSSVSSPLTHTTLVGRVDVNERYKGVRFRIGVPEDMNHLDLQKAAPPLDRPELWWSWTDGYVFARIFVKSAVFESAGLQLGSAPYNFDACSADVPVGCKDDRPRAVLDAFDPTVDVVSFDIATLYAGLDLLPPPQANTPTGRPLDASVSCFMDLHEGSCDSYLTPFGIDWSTRRPPSSGVATLFQSSPR